MPQSLPRPAIHLDGAPHDSLTADLVSIVVEESLSAPARLMARFVPGGGRGSADPGVGFGTRLTVWQGIPPNQLVAVFDGRVCAVQSDFPDAGAPVLVLHAEDALGAFRARERTRVFEHMTDAQMVEAIADEHGLLCALALAAPVPVHERTVQLNQSDAAFLADRLAALGADMRIDGQTLVVTDAPGDGQPAVLVYGDNLTTCSLCADIRAQRSAVGVLGWDPRAKQVVGAAATDADLDPFDDGLSGGRAREQAFGPAVSLIVDMAPATSGEALALARARYRARAAWFVTGTASGVAPALKAGRRVDLQGLGPAFSGAYQVTGVRHRFDSKAGFRTEFGVRRPTMGEPGARAGRQESTDADRHAQPSRTTDRAARAARGRRPSAGRRAARR